MERCIRVYDSKMQSFVHEIKSNSRRLVKIHSKAFFTDPSSSEEIFREIMASIALKSPCINSLDSIFIEGDFLIIVYMEEIQNDLKELIQEKMRAQSYSFDKGMYCDLMLALSHLEQNKMLPIQFSIENLMIGSNNQLLFSDFSNCFDNFKFKGDTVKFLPGYTAPELFLGLKPSSKSTSFSLGSVLYIL